MGMQALELSEVRSGTHSHVNETVAALYKENGRLLVGLAMRVGLSADEAADVAQEAHIRLWLELSRGNIVQDAAAWTSRVVYRLAMDHHRLQRRLRELVTRIPGRTQTDPSDLPQLEYIWAAVDRLPNRERAALYLRFRADMSYDVIGAVMDITPGAARMSVSRGLARLRNSIVLKDQDHD
jgi:RNA polymerase sigma factor (sigma-70 family)